MEFIKFIQLLAILQGFYLLLVFLPKKSKKPSYYLFIGTVVSLLLYLIGDDTNLWLKQNWFLFDIFLFITFYLLFIKYVLNNKKTFDSLDYLLFIPNFLILIAEISDLVLKKEILPIIILEKTLNWVFVFYLMLGLYFILKEKKQNWLLPFTITLIVILVFSYYDDELLEVFPENKIVAVIASGYFTPLAVSVVFYYISFKLHLQPNKFFKSIFEPQYKSSNLNNASSIKIKEELLFLMQEQKPFKNPRLTLNEVAKKLQVPKHHISQIISLEFETNFNDFLNRYRVNEFKFYLKNDMYPQFTIMGIAKEAGFNSKSSFNTIFKEIEGITPSEYRTTLAQKFA